MKGHKPNVTGMKERIPDPKYPVTPFPPKKMYRETVLDFKISLFPEEGI